jgi:hypothetical protein
VNLSDALKTELGTNHGPRCSTCILMESLTKEDAAALQAAFDNDKFTGAAIVRALRSQGHAASPANIIRHRRGDCQK